MTINMLIRSGKTVAGLCVISLSLLLDGCASSNREITSVTGAKPNSFIEYSEDIKEECNDFTFGTNAKNLFVEFDASPSLTARLHSDLQVNYFSLTDSKNKADLIFTVKSEFAAVRPVNSRYVHFEQVGSYIEDTSKTITTGRMNKNPGVNVNLQYLNPIAFITGNIIRGLNHQRTDSWVQGKGRDPDGKCLKSPLNSCEYWQYIHELNTTITEEKTGKTCKIKSQAKNMMIKPEILVDQHIKLVGDKLFPN